MATFTAQDVKRLRDETDAPMMECKKALEEADGDFDKAKAILREKGKAAAAKRAGRQTGEGVVAFALSEDKKTLGGVILECETDFVARNEDFVAMADELAKAYLTQDPGSDPLAVKVGDKTAAETIETAVGKIRENIKITRAIHATTSDSFATYVHHDRTKGVAVEVKGEANASEVGYKLAIQSVAFPPEFITRDEVPQDKVQAELEVETQRAINEGKTPDIAKNIAQGRINKEYYKRVVLLEQPFYLDPSKSVKDYMQEAGGSSFSVGRVIRLSVGEGE